MKLKCYLIYITNIFKKYNHVLPNLTFDYKTSSRKKEVCCGEQRDKSDARIVLGDFGHFAAEEDTVTLHTKSINITIITTMLLK